MTFISKVLEKAAFKQISKHVQKNDLLSANQSGYKQYHSCEKALLEVVNNIQQFIQNDNFTAVRMLDLSAAFDTVDHNCLLYKLKNNFGITGNALQWLSSYLSNRSLSVVINGCYSTSVPIKFIHSVFHKDQF